MSGCCSIVVDAQTTINHNVMVMEMTTRCQIVRHLVRKNALKARLAIKDLPWNKGGPSQTIILIQLGWCDVQVFMPLCTFIT